MRGPRSGFTLLEIILASALLAGMLGLCMRVYIECSRITLMSQLAHARLEQARNLDHDLRSLIQASVGLAEQAGEYRQDDGTLVLELPAMDSTHRRAVVSRIPESRLPFIAVLNERNGSWEAESFRVYREPLLKLAFETDTPGLVQCRYRIGLQEGERVPEQIPMQVIWAHPRGLTAESMP